MHTEFTGEFTSTHYSLKELATLYGMDYRTFKKHISPYAQEIGPLVGRFYSTRQVNIIVAHIGPPSNKIQVKE